MTPKEYQAMNDIDLFGVYRGLQATICIPGTRKIDWERDRLRAAKRLQLLPEVNRRGDPKKLPRTCAYYDPE